MRAIVIEEPGNADVLKLKEVKAPRPGGGEVLVRVHAAGLNRADLLQRRGMYPPPPGIDPAIPGLEYAGVIESTGPRVVGRRKGDRVMGLIGGGAYADYVVVHEREVIPVPDDMSLTDAAAVPEAFLTAWRAVFLEGGLEPGQWCLIRAAASGIGQAAVQLVRALGAYSLGTSRSAERLEQLSSLGLTAGWQEGDGPLRDVVEEHTHGAGVDVVLDLLGGGHLNENLSCMREEARLVSVGVLAGIEDKLDFSKLLMRRLTLRGMTMRSLPLERRIELAHRFTRLVMPLLAAGKLRPVVDQVYPAARVAEAHKYMESNRHFGKLVLDMSDHN